MSVIFSNEVEAAAVCQTCAHFDPLDPDEPMSALHARAKAHAERYRHRVRVRRFEDTTYEWSDPREGVTRDEEAVP